MALQKHEEEAMELIMKACQKMGWVIAYSEGEEEITHIVIGDQRKVKELVAEANYTIAVPPKVK